VSDTPGQEFIDAVVALKFACERIGIKPPALLGLHTGTAVNLVEAAIIEAGQANLIRETIGGIEVLGLKIKPRLS
jgi:hypothetical protein